MKSSTEKPKDRLLKTLSILSTTIYSLGKSYLEATSELSAMNRIILETMPQNEQEQSDDS